MMTIPADCTVVIPEVEAVGEVVQEEKMSSKSTEKEKETETEEVDDDVGGEIVVVQSQSSFANTPIATPSAAPHMSTMTMSLNTVDCGIPHHRMDHHHQIQPAAEDNDDDGDPAAAAAEVITTAEQARQVLGTLIRGGVSGSFNEQTRVALQFLLNDYDTLKDKASKLKSLLGRSAKAQREAKVELDAATKRLEQREHDLEKLNKRLHQLATRPTHMELLADFESNFDRVLLQMDQQQQAGGQATASPTTTFRNASSTTKAATSADEMDYFNDTSSSTGNGIVDGLLLQELRDGQKRMESLEHMNGALRQRSSQLEAELLAQQREQEVLRTQLAHVELEKRMARYEADQARQSLHERDASVREMQLEIDLVTQTSAQALAKAAHGEQLMKTIQCDQKTVQHLEDQVHALKEWALASTEAKRLAQDRNHVLETQLRALQNTNYSSTSIHHPLFSSSSSSSSSERVLFRKSASLVVGAGDVAVRIFSLNDNDEDKDDHPTGSMIHPHDDDDDDDVQNVVLRWKFDLADHASTIDLSILQGKCEKPSYPYPQPQQRTGSNRGPHNAHAYLIQDRTVVGGAAGETENAFIRDQACTLVWSNVKSWVRPKTIKYVVEAVVVVEGQSS